MSGPATSLERLAKLTIIISLATAVWIQARDIGLLGLAGGLFFGAWVAGRIRPRLVRRATLFATYLLPAVFVLTRERFVEVYSVVWAALLCGVIVSTGRRLRWSLPSRWRLPLVFWALLAACVWPVIALREGDFYLDQMFANGWSATVAMGIIVGILWFDWLFSAYGSSDGSAFDDEILLPLAFGWMVAAAVGLYQMFGQMSFLNPGLWATLGRATGLLGDSNVFGIISAMWGPALVALTFTRPARWTGWWIGAIGLPLSWLAVWGASSRSALPVALLGLVAVAIALYRSAGSHRLIWVTACALTVVLALAVSIAGGLSVHTPIFRILQEFGEPQWSMAWVRRTLSALWTRNAYGIVAMQMIRQFPLVGVGLSSFYYLAAIFSWKLLPNPLPFDNAQNWYRHELAELGVVGSLGWIVWTVSFVVLLVTARPRPGRQLTATVLRLVIAGFGLISLVGMPGQALIVSFTFWTLAFWFVQETATPSPEIPSSFRSPAIAWVAVWVIVLGHVAATAYVGWTALRPPVRAARAGMDYSLGFYLPEGNGSDAFRWAKQRAVVVFSAPKEWLGVSVKVDQPELERTPVDVKVWVQGKTALKTRLRTDEPVTRYVRVPPNTRIMIETWVSRLHANDPATGDRRERGMLVRWTFVDAPPPGAIVDGG